MASLKISAQAYGPSAGRRLLWLVPLMVVGPALAFAVLRDRATDVTRLAPFLSVPAIAVMVLMFASFRQRHVTIEVEGRFVRITGWRRSICEGSVTQVEVLPWIMPGLGVAQGAAACLQIDNGLSFSVGAWGYAAAANAPRSTHSTDCFVDAKTLASLLAAMGVQDAAADPHTRDTQFTLVKYAGLSAAIGTMTWWFGTMAFLGVFGALFGERLVRQPWGLAVVGIVSLLAIGFGMAKVFARSRREKPKYKLTIANRVIELRNANGAAIWTAGAGSVTITNEAFVYRTKYGSHRFPVLVLTGPQTTLRLGVWDVQPQWQSTQSNAGAAPQFLVASPDWERLLSAIRA